MESKRQELKRKGYECLHIANPEEIKRGIPHSVLEAFRVEAIFT